MKKVASLLLSCAILATAGAVSAHPHSIQKNENDNFLANGAGHPGFSVTLNEDGTYTYTSTGFDAYVEGKHGSANSGYGMETAHHGPDLGTPGKADDTYVQDSPTFAKSPDDQNPAIQ